MPIESWILFLVALLCVLQAVILKRDLLSPLNIFLLSQTGTMGVAWLRLDPAMTDWHLLTWLAWFTAIASFAAGAFCVRFLTPYPEYHQKTSAKELRQPIDYNWYRHFAFSLLALAIFFFGLFSIVRYAGGIPLFSEKLTTIMSTKLSLGKLGYLYSSGPLVTLLFAPACFSWNPVRWIRILSRILIIVSLCANILVHPSRGALFFTVIIVLVMSHYLHRAITMRTIILLSVLLVSAFIGLGMLRQQYLPDKIIGKSASEEIILLPYRYVANNFWNLDYALNPPTDREIHPFTWGADFVNGITEITPIGGKLQTSYHWDNMYNARVTKTSYYNTTGFLWEVRKDLGWLGIAIFPFFTGFLLTWIYRKWQVEQSVPTLVFHTMFVYLLGWWWFTEAYKNGLYWLWAAFLGFTFHYTSRKTTLNPTDSTTT